MVPDAWQDAARSFGSRCLAAALERCCQVRVVEFAARRIRRELAYREIRRRQSAPPIVFDPGQSYQCWDCGLGTYARAGVRRCAACGSAEITPLRTIFQECDGRLAEVAHVLQRPQSPGVFPPRSFPSTVSRS